MKIPIILYSLLLITGSVWAAEAEKQAADFSLFDQRGDFHQMSSYNDRKGIVLLSRNSECPSPADIVNAYSQIKTKFVDLGFEFMMINSSTSTDRDRVSREIDKLGLDLPVLMDENLLFSKFLRISKTNEISVYDPKTSSVIYRGSADRNLEVALFSILAGEQVMNSLSNTSGCEINYGSPDSSQAI
ncbi:MAG: redoxin domain-containing protein [Gammaproteobacteria bacterium]|jgi:peroxiredoxin|nr:redoxin domain-containing protein [Gammaproteobacteria bacterium]HJO11914.1 redoxin domain-containing protein [Gammaproteobacteria bacterium]|tara:strand:+ start:414 stop:974 length:561 start_codon:yes stop_codon:yes gene_type:complete